MFPGITQEQKLVAMDLGAMIAGAKYRGEFEDRLKAFLRRSSRARDRSFCSWTNCTLVGAGAAEGSNDAANIKTAALPAANSAASVRPRSTSIANKIEKDPALERRFQPVQVAEPTVEATIAILRGLKERYEVHHGVRIQIPRSSQRRHFRIATSRIVFCRTRRLISWTKPRRASRWSWIPAHRTRPARPPDSPTRNRAHVVVEGKRRREAKERLKRLDEELANLKEKSKALTAQWQNEKTAVNAVSIVQQQLEQAKLELEKASAPATSPSLPNFNTAKFPTWRKTRDHRETIRRSHAHFSVTSGSHR